MAYSNGSIVSFLTATDTGIGVGVLVGDGEVVTCAHVMNAALNRDLRDREVPAESVQLCFPLLKARPQRVARVVRWFPPVPDAAIVDDIAVLLIQGDLPDDAVPARIDVRPVAPGRTVDVFGYPGVPPRPDGAWVPATVRGTVGGGRLQLDAHNSAALRMQPGYSGSPVIDRETGAVLGLLMTAPHAESGDRDAYAIAADRIMALRGTGFPTRQAHTLNVRLTAHGGAVTSVAFSPDGRTLATGSADRTLRLWDIASHAAIATLPHPATVRSVAFGPDGGMLASGSDDGTVRLWVQTGDGHARWSSTPTALASHTDVVRALAFSPDGRLLASGGADQTVLWDVAAHRRSIVVGDAGAVMSVAFIPDGEVLAIASADGYIGLIDVVRHRSRGRFSVDDGVWPMAFNANYGRLVTGAADGTVTEWHFRESSDSVWFVAVGSNGTIVIGGDSEYCSAANVTRTEVGREASHSGAVNALAFSPDGKMLASGSDDNTVLLSIFEEKYPDTSMGPLLVGHSGPVTAMAFNSDGSVLATGSVDGTIRLWDVKTQVNVDVLADHTDAISSLSFIWEDRMIISGSADSTARMWNRMVDGGGSNSITGNDDIWAWVFTPHTKTDDGGVESEIGSIEGDFDDHVRSLAFSPDGRTYAVALGDNTVRVFDSMHAVATFSGYVSTVRSVAFSPDGTKLAVDFGDTITSESISQDGSTTPRWATTGNASVAFYPPSVNSVAFSPDGTLLATGDVNGTIWLWDVATSTVVAGFAGHSQAVNTVLFSPSGRTLATGGADGIARLWLLS